MSAENAATASSSDRPLVLVVYCSVGSGHRSAGQAVEQALHSLKGKHPQLPENAEIQLIDMLDFGAIRFDGDATASVFTGIMSPFYNFTWHYVLTGRILWGGGTVWSHVLYSAFTRFVERRKPRLIVSTHILSSNVSVAARMLTGQKFPIVCVPTDYGFEGLWPSLSADLFCVPDDFMVQEIMPRRVPEEKIAVTGIPVRAGFAEEHNREDVLELFGLPKDKRIVLVMAGARLRQPYVPFRKIVDALIPKLPQYPDMHFVFLPGMDEDYASKLRLLFTDLFITNASVCGYVENMPALMAASDLIVAKSGGLAVTECLCAQLPLILVGKSYGQERANTITVTTAGAALKAETPQELEKVLFDIQENPDILSDMVKNGACIRKPHAALDVAVRSLDLVGNVVPPKKRFMNFYWGKKPVRRR